MIESFMPVFYTWLLNMIISWGAQLAQSVENVNLDLGVLN